MLLAPSRLFYTPTVIRMKGRIIFSKKTSTIRPTAQQKNQVSGKKLSQSPQGYKETVETQTINLH